MTTPEGRVKKRLSDKLKETFQGRCWKFMPVQSGYGMAALDYILCIAGRFVAIETKKDAKSKLTARQRATADDIRRAGGFVYVVYDDETINNAIANICLLEKLPQAE